MRRQRMTLVALALALVLVSQTAFTCSRRDMISYAGDVVSALTDALPLLTQGGVQTAKIQQAITIGNQLVTAFRDNQDASALQLTSALITQFQSIADDAGLIPNPMTRTRILVTLALGNVALHYISNHIHSEVPSGVLSASPALVVIRMEARKPIWRCRSSQTGKFSPMSYCKQHPDVSTVERKE